MDEKAQKKILDGLNAFFELRGIVGSGAAHHLLDLLMARCSDCANGPKCFYDREPVCSNFERKDVE